MKSPSSLETNLFTSVHRHQFDRPTNHDGNKFYNKIDHVQLFKLSWDCFTLQMFFPGLWCLFFTHPQHGGDPNLPIASWMWEFVVRCPSWHQGLHLKLLGNQLEVSRDSWDTDHTSLDFRHGCKKPVKSFEPRQYEAISCGKKNCSCCNFHVFPMDFDFDKKLLVPRNFCFSGTRQACNTGTFAGRYPFSFFSQAIQEGDPEHWDICLAAFNRNHVLTGQHKGVRQTRPWGLQPMPQGFHATALHWVPLPYHPSLCCSLPRILQVFHPLTQISSGRVFKKDESVLPICPISWQRAQLAGIPAD